MDRWSLFWFMVLGFAALAVAALGAHSISQSVDIARQRVESICPVTHIADNGKCLECHYVKQDPLVTRSVWAIKPGATETVPIGFTWVDGRDEYGVTLVGRLLLEEIDSGLVEQTFALLRRHGVSKLVIELQSPGGPTFEMLRIVGLMSEFKGAPGHIIETRVNGGACSAALIVFANGSIGHRLAYPGSMLMWHKAKVADQSPAAQKVLDKMDRNANSWLSKRCKLSVAEIEERTKDGDWWMTAYEAVEAGIADGLL